MGGEEKVMWTEEQLKSYEGELWVSREFTDNGFAFVDILTIHAKGHDDPVYQEEFMFDGECGKFLELLGFVEDDSEAGFFKPAKNLPIREKLLDMDMYNAIHKIGDIVFEYASFDVDRSYEIPWMEDRRDETPNPYYDQTKSGLFLEMYYGMPSSLWTPWGKWSIGGSGSGNFSEVNKKVLERLGAVLHIAQYNDKMGTQGPVYKLTKIDDVDLPEAKIELRENFAEYYEVHTAWKKLTIQNILTKERDITQKLTTRNAEIVQSYLKSIGVKIENMNDKDMLKILNTPGNLIIESKN
jgi:hypothetical protein